jgi:hypothetical protein
MSTLFSCPQSKHALEIYYPEKKRECFRKTVAATATASERQQVVND